MAIFAGHFDAWADQPVLIAGGLVGQDKYISADQRGAAWTGHMSPLALMQIEVAVRNQSRRPTAFDLAFELDLPHVLHSNLRSFPESV